MAQSLQLVYKDPLLTYLLVSVPSILTLRYVSSFLGIQSPENGFMEPKYYAFRKSVMTSHPFIILWHGEDEGSLVRMAQS